MANPLTILGGETEGHKARELAIAQATEQQAAAPAAPQAPPQTTPTPNPTMGKGGATYLGNIAAARPPSGANITNQTGKTLLGQ